MSHYSFEIIVYAFDAFTVYTFVKRFRIFTYTLIEVGKLNSVLSELLVADASVERLSGTCTANGKSETSAVCLQLFVQESENICICGE